MSDDPFEGYETGKYYRFNFPGTPKVMRVIGRQAHGRCRFRLVIESADGWRDRDKWTIDVIDALSQSINWLGKEIVPPKAFRDKRIERNH